MSDPGYHKAAKMVGMKVPLVENQTFVGRRREIKKMSASLEGSQVTPVWVWGPRRMGKTSLSYRISESASLRTARVSFDAYEWKDIDHLCDILALEARGQLKLDIQQTGRPSLDGLAKKGSKDKPIILILDEFDRIAVNLEQNEQAFLRMVLQDNPFFGMVFISRVKPEQLLQDYSDESSRLLGICEIVRMPMLSKEEVCDLIHIVQHTYNIDFPDWVATWIYNRVGGYPICVQALLREFLLQASEHCKAPAEQEMVRRDGLFIDAMESYLRGLWKDLPYPVRNWILNKTSETSGTLKRQIEVLHLMDGDTFLRPFYLVEIGAEKDVISRDEPIPEFIGLAERLNDSIRICNERSLRKGNCVVFQVTQQIFYIFQIARSVADELDLNDRINTLYKICVEGTSSDKLPKEDRCLIPKDVRNTYKKSEGFEVLVAWRNFCFHDASHDLEINEVSDRYKNIGQICCKYLGPYHFKAENKSEFNTLYRGILSDVVTAVEGLSLALR
jgi:hypothetical protein